ncbi:MAG: SufS family cysteine desulfurase [Planctomycetota bacterium]
MSVSASLTPTHDPAGTSRLLRSEFPILSREAHGQPLAYFDWAATAQKPACVIEAIDAYYRQSNANVHRGLHKLAEEATQQYEDARLKVSRFVGAPSAESCVFVRGATEGINLVAHAATRPGNPLSLGKGDRVVISHMEHHSNIVPWQLACEATGAELSVVPITDAGELDLEAFHEMLDERVKIVSVVWVSNALGTINPAKQIVEAAHGVGAKVLLDACQAAPHPTHPEQADVYPPLNVNQLDCDFLVFSGHKLFGPTGIGVLFGKPELLAAMPPYQGGGEMISRVTFAKTEYADPPNRFEAGTPNIAGAIGLGAAVDWYTALDHAALARHEADLLAYGTEKLEALGGVRIIGTAEHKASILSFVVDGMHPYDLGPVLDRQGVAVRTGHHCAEPVMDRFGVPATVRASLSFLNTTDELDRLAAGIEKAKAFFA